MLLLYREFSFLTLNKVIHSRQTIPSFEKWFIYIFNYNNLQIPLEAFIFRINQRRKLLLTTEKN